MRHQELRQVRLVGSSSLIEIFATISFIALNVRFLLSVEARDSYIENYLRNQVVLTVVKPLPWANKSYLLAVSYTHLTLPTIYSV